MSNISSYVDDLRKEYPKLSDYELLSIAVQQERNDILMNGLLTGGHDGHVGLEYIGMALGSPDAEGSPDKTITDSLDRISRAVYTGLESIREELGIANGTE